MSVLMNVVSIWRSRSGLAWASCSCRKRAGSILLEAVIAFFSWVSVEGHPEDHAVAAFPSGPHSGWGAVVHHLGGRHSRVEDPPVRLPHRLVPAAAMRLR